MQILEGKKIASAILLEVKNKIIIEKVQPQLAVVLVGTDAASKIYVNLKGKAADKTGIGFHKIETADTISEEDLLAAIADLNADESIDSIIVQLPLPEHSAFTMSRSNCALRSRAPQPKQVRSGSWPRFDTRF